MLYDANLTELNANMAANQKDDERTNLLSQAKSVSNTGKMNAGTTLLEGVSTAVTDYYSPKGA